MPEGSKTIEERLTAIEKLLKELSSQVKQVDNNIITTNSSEIGHFETVMDVLAGIYKHFRLEHMVFKPKEGQPGPHKGKGCNPKPKEPLPGGDTPATPSSRTHTPSPERLTMPRILGIRGKPWEHHVKK